MTLQQHFADRFVESARRLKNPLCVGLDPHLELIPQDFGVRLDAPTSERTARGVLQFLSYVVDDCSGKVPAVKPQIAFFEQLGWRGMRVLEQVTEHARRLGLLVVLDAKRGDIGSTAEAYVRAYLSPDSACKADAITVNPYMGIESLAPFLHAATKFGTGLFVLAKTSNSGAGEFQDLSIDGQRLFERVAFGLRPRADALVGTSGWSSLGVVAGATFPVDAVELRRILPHSLFLVTGFGAQGGQVPSAIASLVSRDGVLEGGLVSSSRSILFGNVASLSADNWRSGLRSRLQTAIRQMSEATHLVGG